MRVQNPTKDWMENNTVKACDIGYLKRKTATTKKEKLEGLYNNYNINITIDSIHLISSISPFYIPKNIPIYNNANEEDEFGFSSNNKHIIQFKVNVGQKKEFIQKYIIYINESTNIHVTYHFISKSYAYQFSGLSQYKELDPTLVHIIKHIYKTHTKISRIDIALDSFSNHHLFNTNPVFKMFNQKTIKDNNSNNESNYINVTYSNNKKSFECIIYPKDGFRCKNDFTYNEITRIELRLENNFLRNRKLKDLLLNADSIIKLESIVLSILADCNITYNNSTYNFEHIKIKEVVHDFITFLESNSNEVNYSNYRKFKNEIQKQADILSKLKFSYNVNTVTELTKMVISKKLNIHQISQKTSIHRQTVTKIIDYYTSHIKVN